MSMMRTFALSVVLLWLATLSGTAQGPTPGPQGLATAQPRPAPISAQEGRDRMGIVGYADHSDLRDVRMARDRVFDLDRVDVLAAGHDHVLHAVDEE